MTRLKLWIHAFRLRTLFLAVATVILASGMAWHEGAFNTPTFILAFLLAVSIQIRPTWRTTWATIRKVPTSPANGKVPYVPYKAV